MLPSTKTHPLPPPTMQDSAHPSLFFRFLNWGFLTSLVSISMLIFTVQWCPFASLPVPPGEVLREGTGAPRSHVPSTWHLPWQQLTAQFNVCSKKKWIKTGALGKFFLIIPLNFLKWPFKSEFIITFQTITLHDCSQDILVSDPMTMQKSDSCTEKVKEGKLEIYIKFKTKIPQ